MEKKTALQIFQEQCKKVAAKNGWKKLVTGHKVMYFEDAAVKAMHEYGRQCFEAGRESFIVTESFEDIEVLKYKDYEHFSGKELESFSDGE